MDDREQEFNKFLMTSLYDIVLGYINDILEVPEGMISGLGFAVVVFPMEEDDDNGNAGHMITNVHMDNREKLIRCLYGAIRKCDELKLVPPENNSIN